MMSNDSGILYVVATPIGNQSDLSARAREILARADLIAAEDTRHTGRLLKALGVRQPMISLHEHNEQKRVPQLLARLEDGETIALVSDAGTPLISDPGFRLVAAARNAGLTVSPIPGPCAAIAAISVAGLPTDRFVFEGFLPSRGAARRRHLEALLGEKRTLVFYESVHRIAALLKDLAQVLGPDRQASVARELTKRHETVTNGTLGDLAQAVEQDAATRRGEYVVVVHGSEAPAGTEAPQRLLAVLLDELPPARAAAVAARLTGRPRDEVYQMAVAMARQRPMS